MSDSDIKFAGSIPALYDRYLGPFIFEPYASDLVERLADFKEGNLLEVAAGTGVVTRVLAGALPQTVAITATDLNQPMIDFAAAQLASPRLTWRQANGLNLPFPDETFDVVVCQFGVMFFPDKSAGYREALRVLKPGGRFIFSSWDRIEENEVTQVVVDAVATLFPQNPPQFMARTPHGYYQRDRILADVRQAGFSRVLFDTVERRSRTASPQGAAIGLCQGTPLRNEIEERDPSRLEEATEVAAAAVRARFGPGPIDGKIQAHVITATM